MRISIKIKHSIFLALLLFLTIFVLSVVVLDEIRKEHRDEYEDILASYAKTANLYTNEMYLKKSADSHQQFLKYSGGEIAANINKLIHKPVVIYTLDGKKIGTTLFLSEKTDFLDMLPYVAKGKSAYQVKGTMLYYLTPLIIQDEQVGVIQFSYSIKQYEDSYNKTRSTFIVVGVLVLIFSFMLATLYFNSFTNGILKLKEISDRIKNGNYSVPVLKRRDELGALSEGIYYMSCQIHDNMKDMNEEQRKLNLAVEKLTKLEKEQKRFIGNISHEFKTPLTSIRAYLDLISMYPEDLELLEQAKDVIDKETLRLGSMVEKVLKLSELEKYDFEQDIKRIEISEVLETISSNMKGRMDKYGINLEMELEKVYIMADKESLTHIFVNVLDNAIKYNIEQGRIFVKCLNQGDFAHIEIENTGEYVPAEEREKIFTPFYRLDKNRSRKTGGTGLGLALVKELVLKQGGTIKVLKSDMERTVFLIVFPSNT